MKDTTYALLKIKNLKTNYDVPKFKTFKINIEKLLNVQEYDWGYPIEESTTWSFAIVDQNAKINTFKENLVQLSLESDEFIFNIDSPCTTIAEKRKLESRQEVTVPNFEMSIKKESKTKASTTACEFYYQ